MDTTTILNNSSNIYGVEYDYDNSKNTLDLNNKLFCTFTTLEDLDGLVDSLQSKYTIMYNKMFVLHIKSNNEYVVTYNVEQGNISSIPDNTILVHRKKDSNTLYTINALNTLIKQLNNGQLDSSYRINWADYKNCVLLTKGPELKRINTKLFNIIQLDN